MCAIITNMLPETPKFLASVGREKDVLKTLQWMFQKNTGKPVEDFPVQYITMPEVNEEEKQYNKKTM